MPLVRVDLREGKSAEYSTRLGEIVYRAMVETLNVPEKDKFQVITSHPASDFIFDREYLGIQRSNDCVFIQITLNAGRATEIKQQFYKAVADALHNELKLRREDVLINLVEVQKQDWSFGNGIAQYVP